MLFRAAVLSALLGHSWCIECVLVVVFVFGDALAGVHLSHQRCVEYGSEQLTGAASYAPSQMCFLCLFVCGRYYFSLPICLRWIAAAELISVLVVMTADSAAQGLMRLTARQES